MLEKITDLVDQVAAAADEIESARRLPDSLVHELKKAGAFRALMPTKFGGLGAEFEDYVYMVQALAKADASTAWCVNQAAVIGLTSLWLPEARIREIWASPETSIANGPPFNCLIEPDGDQFKLNGHWGFSSGCQHATWMLGAAKYAGGGYRIAYFRPDDVSFSDNWQVPGLRGTGSFEFTISDLSIDASLVTDLAASPTHLCDLTITPSTLLFAVSFACVALGVARATLDDVIDLAQGKVPRWSSTKVQDDPDVQRFVGKATARWRSADAYLHRTLENMFPVIRDTAEVTHEQRSELRMAGTHVIQECADVVDLAYKISGSTGIYQNQNLQRRFQDMHVITQHVQGREAYFALLGRHQMTGHYEIGPMT
ncbi:MAG: acyl-CoA dehydrogenase family protein [Pseudomonadales bacterium]|nr:acyl-CoA dehydrogenase family protein [Pseudomonadales bacterium]